MKILVSILLISLISPTHGTASEKYHCPAESKKIVYPMADGKKEVCEKNHKFEGKVVIRNSAGQKTLEAEFVNGIELIQIRKICRK